MLYRIRGFCISGQMVRLIGAPHSITNLCATASGRGVQPDSMVDPSADGSAPRFDNIVLKWEAILYGNV